MLFFIFHSITYNWKLTMNIQKILNQLSPTGPNGIIVIFFISIACSAIIVAITSMMVGS